MRIWIAAACLTGFLNVAAAEDLKDPTLGKWVAESVTRDGKAVDPLKGAVRVHDGGKYTMTPADGSKAAPSSGTYKLNGTKSPIEIDVTAKGGTYDGKTLLGIVKVEGDTMTVAFAEPGKDRPTKFESAEGSGVVVAVYKKAK